MRSGVAGTRHVVWHAGERLAHSEGALLITVADFADRVLRAIVPGNARFAVDIHPLAVFVAHRPESIAIIVERDIEVVAGAVADLPFAQEMIWIQAAAGGCSRAFSLRELDTLNIRQSENLPVPIFEDDDDGGAALGGRGRLGKAA